MGSDSYRIVVKPLPAESGGGWIASAPDLPGCVGDGPTVQEARRRLREAILAWQESAEAQGRRIPSPKRLRW